MGEIYKIVNDFNNQVYIGKTMKTTTARKREHLCQLNDGSAIHNSILKHGIEHFEWIPIEVNIDDKDKLAEREMYWINYYDSYNHGYNMTLGGEGGNGTHAANLKQWKKDNPEKVKEITDNFINWKNEHPQEFQEACLRGAETRKRKYGNDITKAANEAVRKKVKCIETGVIYNSVSEATKAVGGKSTGTISKACNGHLKTAYKFHWEWAT